MNSKVENSEELCVLENMSSLLIKFEKVKIDLPQAVGLMLKNKIVAVLKEQHTKRQKFEVDVTELLKFSNLSNEQYQLTISISTKYQQLSTDTPGSNLKSSKISCSSSSSKKFSLALVKEQVAGLRLSNLEEEQNLEHEKSESLKVMLALNEALLEHQVLDEELKRDG